MKYFINSVAVFRRNSKLLQTVFFIALLILFLSRAFMFAYEHGGNEQDSGIFIGAAKVIADRGIYASYGNAVWQDGAGIRKNIYKRHSFQDEEGFVHLDAGLSVGFGYLLPQALLIKIFGSGRWQFSLWSFITYSLLFGGLFYVVLRMGGWLAFFLFYLLNWTVPQIAINFSYEAYSESIALLYVLISFGLMAFRKSKIQWRYMCFSGLIFGIGIQTKMIVAMYLAAFFVLGLYELIKEKAKFNVVKKWLCFLGGVLIPVASFMISRYFYIVSKTSVGDYSKLAQSDAGFFDEAGSGISNFFKIDYGFVYKKLMIWMDLGIRYPVLFWGIFIFCCIYFCKKINTSYIIKFLVVGSIGWHICWLVFLSKTGWFRHAWPAMIMSVALVSIVLGSLWQKLLSNAATMKYSKFIIPVVMLLPVFMIYFSFDSNKIFPSYRISQDDVFGWHRLRYSRHGILGLPTNHIFPVKEQQETADFINNNINKNDRIYYLDYYYGFELSPYVDKVFFSLHRYFQVDRFNSSINGRSFIIFSPFNRGNYPFSYVGKDYFFSRRKRFCGKDIFANKFYYICELKKNN